MTYAELATLMQDTSFRGRIKVACLKLALEIMNEDATTTDHAARLTWAVRTYQQADFAANQVQPPLCLEPVVEAQGAAVSDADLQTAVNDTVQKLLTQAPPMQNMTPPRGPA